MNTDNTTTNKSTSSSKNSKVATDYPNKYSSQQKDKDSEKSNTQMSQNQDHKEGETTKKIENQTAKIPSGVYLSLAVGAMALSVAAMATRKNKDLSQFFGSWVTPLLVLGLYNKNVKTQGSD